MQIDQLSLRDVGGIRKLDIPFNAGMNLICGTNGVGKSTVLEAIAAVFSPNYPSTTIKKRAAASAEAGSIDVQLRSGGAEKRLTGLITAVNPEEQSRPFGSLEEGPAIITIRANRDFSYTKSESIARDPDLSIHDIQSRQKGTLPGEEVKRWFSNRWLMRPHGDNWPGHRRKNLETAIKMFGYLDSSVTLSHVDTSTFDVFVNTANGTHPFEFLSSGFRSAYYLLLGIIKEVEFRKLDVSADKFSGVILIDEIDLHLHPTWQRNIAEALKSTFRSAQIIATTHSPHTIQAASASEVIALIRQEDGETGIRELPVGEYGFSGWTIEEILKDVMGMEDTQTSHYREAVEAFDTALDLGSEAGVTQALGILDRMLHPSSPMRKVFEIQAAAATDRHE